MKNLTEGKLGKSLLSFSIPAILTAFLVQSYALADTVIIGRFLGESCFAASSSTSALVVFLSSLFWGYGTGAAVFLARLFAEKSYARLRRVIRTNILLCFTVPTLIGILTVLLREPIFDLLNVDRAIRQDAAIYFIIIMLGAGIREVNTLCSFSIGAMGDSSFGFYLSLISAVINVGGNLLSVTVLNWGIAGVAAFSILSSLVVDLCYFVKFNRFFRSIIPEKEHVFFDRSELRTVFSYSTVCILQQGSIYIASLFLSPIINGLGTAALAARSIVSSVMSYVTVCHSNSARAIATHNAQCLGIRDSAENKLAKMRRALFVGTLQSQTIGLIVTIPILLFPGQIASVFLSGETSAETLALATAVLRYDAFICLLYPFTTIMHSFLRAVKSMGFLYVATLFGSLFNLILNIPLIKYYGLFGHVTAQGIAYLGEIILLLVIYFSGKWIPRELQVSSSAVQNSPVTEGEKS